MKIRSLFIVALCLVFTISSVSCQSGNAIQGRSLATSGDDIEKNASIPDDVPDGIGSDISAKINVLLMDWPEKDGINPSNRKRLTGYGPLLEEFKALNPNIELDVVSVPTADYSTKSSAMLAANSLDVVDQMVYSAEYAEDLRPYIERDKEQLKDLVIPVYEIMTGWDKSIVTALPTKAKIYSVYYDKKIFDDWGVEYLHTPTTWEEIREKAEMMTGINPKTGKQNYGIWKTYITEAQDLIETYYTMCTKDAACYEITGDTMLDVKLTFDTDPVWKEAMMYWKDLLQFSDPAGKEYMGYDKFGTVDNDIAIMFIGWTDGIISMAEAGGTAGDLTKENRIGFADFPRNSDGKFTSMFGMGIGIGMNKNSQEKEAAWQFIKWNAVSPTASEYLYNNLGYIPTNKQGLVRTHFDQKYPDLAEVIKNQSRDYQQAKPLIEGSYSIIDKASTEYWLGLKGIDEAIEDIQNGTEGLLEAARSNQ